MLVGLGAAAGGMCRYLVTTWTAERWGTAFPYGTLIVNVSGSFLLAFLVVVTTDRLGQGPEVRLLLGTDFCFVGTSVEGAIHLHLLGFSIMLS